MSANIKAAEQVAVIGTIDPATVANTEVFTDVVDAGRWHQVLGLALIGNLPAETISFKAYRCDSAGNNKVQLKAAATLAAHATNNDNTQIVINVRNDEVGAAADGARYVCFGLVTGGATGGPCAAVALGVNARYQPGSDSDLASVVEIVG
jgi:hypothetical protein